MRRVRELRVMLIKRGVVRELFICSVVQIVSISMFIFKMQVISIIVGTRLRSALSNTFVSRKYVINNF